MSRKSIAQDTAISHLAKEIRLARHSGTARLPILGTLASRAGVGRVTMWRALQILRKQGIIVISRGKGVRIAELVAPQPATAAAPPGPDTASRRIARQMVADLLSRLLDPQRPLPRTKDLMRRYAVSYNTMRKAVEILRAQGIVTGDRRACTEFSMPFGGTTVVLIAAGQRGVLRHISARTSDHLRQLEHSCASRGIRLRVLALDESAPDIILTRARTGRQRDDSGCATGYVVWRVGIGDFGNVIPFINNLVLSGSRVSILDEYGDQRSFRFRNPHKALRIWSMAVSDQCALNMARHLLAAGHRRVAYLTPFVPGAHVDPRLAGLRQGFAAAGIDDAVRVCTFGISDNLVGIDGLDALYYLHSAIESFRQKTAPDSFLGWKMRQPENRHNFVTIRMKRARRVLDRINTPDRALGLFDAHLDDLLKLRDCTAWVAINDIVAADCVEFLRRRPRTGQPITVVGFDDSELASHYGFSSYNFNGAAVMHAMVCHALGVALPQGPLNRHGAEEIEGFVNVRTMADLI